MFKNTVIFLTILVFITSAAFAEAIKNLTNRTVIVRLNDGMEINIAPGTSVPVRKSQIVNNAQIEKLARQNIIKVILDQKIKHDVPEKKKGKEKDK